jgi:hypothetical protein
MRQRAHAHLIIASLLALLFVGSVAVPASARLQRFESTERYAYKLINCLRTGGKVNTAGFCVGYGSGRFSAYRKPLDFSHKISNKVAWTYAGRIATAGQCRHDLGSTTDQRFRTVGLRNITNGENLACMWAASPRRMVVYWVRHWYKETSYGGAHWHQIKDPDFRTAGFGVARHPSGRTTLVVNFYGKPVQ